jgi:hypothetical protein
MTVLSARAAATSLAVQSWTNMESPAHTVETVPHALPQTADDVRHLITEAFKEFEPHIQSYGAYSQRMAALTQEYHTLRVKEAFPTAVVEELTLAVTLDVRETPTRLEIILAQLKNQQIDVKKVIFDRVKFSLSLYV